MALTQMYGFRESHNLGTCMYLCVEGMNEFNCSRLGYDHLAVQTSPPS